VPRSRAFVVKTHAPDPGDDGIVGARRPPPAGPDWEQGLAMVRRVLETPLGRNGGDPESVQTLVTAHSAR
jgi:hypothetical protein